MKYIDYHNEVYFIASLFNYIPIKTDAMNGNIYIDVLEVKVVLEMMGIDNLQILGTILKVPQYLNMKDGELAVKHTTPEMTKANYV